VYIKSSCLKYDNNALEVCEHVVLIMQLYMFIEVCCHISDNLICFKLYFDQNYADIHVSSSWQIYKCFSQDSVSLLDDIYPVACRRRFYHLKWCTSWHRRHHISFRVGVHNSFRKEQLNKTRVMVIMITKYNCFNEIVVMNVQRNI